MIVVLADDLSGATELAGVAWARGLLAEVQTDFEPSSTAEVVAIDTDTRCRSAGEAGARMDEIAHRVLAAKPSWIYKKTDSVLRGHVRVELTALLGAVHKRRALFISANPSRGRLIQGGRYLVNGTPLDQTVFATDPEHPATSAAVRELLGREPGAAVHMLGTSHVLPEAGIAIPDVSSSTDLARYAGLLDEATLAAGAAEFFDALLVRRVQSRGHAKGTCAEKHRMEVTLFVCGSAAAWPVMCQGCQLRHIPVFEVPPELFQQPENSPDLLEKLSTWANVVAGALKGAGKALVAIGSLQAPPGCPPHRLLGTLARAVPEILRLAPIDRVLLEGGATAAAVLRQTNWKRLKVEYNLAPGLPLLRVEDRHGPFLVIKPGSYRWPENVWD